MPTAVATSYSLRFKREGGCMVGRVNARCACLSIRHREYVNCREREGSKGEVDGEKMGKTT